MKSADCFVLLDDSLADAGASTSRLFEGHLKSHVCRDPAGLDDWWASVQGDLRAGLHVALAIDYEWGAKLQGIAPRDPQRDVGALTALVFESMRTMSVEQVDAWLAERAAATSPVCGFMDWQASIGRERYDADIARIHALIADGETYQLNYSYRLNGRAFGDPVALYRRLRERQRVGFGALIHWPDDDGWTLSMSPELFVRHLDGRVQARPMKGTAPRGIDAKADRAQAEWLHHDAKNRAENLMIVDLLRNDLGRLAVTGSVTVPSLFDVETYATVLQMTSTVEADLRPEVGLAELLRALFPCGSITGAPKHQTMKRIAELETTPRGLYTGSIGWLAASTDPQRQCPDLSLSVAIRTIALDAPDARGSRAAEAGVGGGIVIDSVAPDEYEETRIKARYLSGFDPGLHLIETMRAGRSTGIANRKRHLARLEGSAARLGFACDRPSIEARLDDAVRAILDDSPHRVRLTLRFDGAVELHVDALQPLPRGPLRVMLASKPLPAGEAALVTMKTSHRATYDAALTSALDQGAVDMLFFNERDELTEGARTNVFVKVDGRWLTPAIACGALPGVMRGVLLDDTEMGASEAVITRAMLMSADAVFVCNALRGRVDVYLAA